MNNKLIIITGPTASGKSTVAKLLCKKYKKCVRLDIDRVKHFVENGFKYNESKEGKNQWKLCTKNVILLTKNYLQTGYVVIVEGALGNTKNWQKIFKELKPKNKFLFLANRSVLYSRNKTRNKKFIMLKKDIDTHYMEFLEDFYLKNFEVVENNKDLKGTIEYIYKVCTKI